MYDLTYWRFGARSMNACHSRHGRLDADPPQWHSRCSAKKNRHSGLGDDFSKCNLLNYNRLLCQMVGIDDEGFSW